MMLVIAFISLMIWSCESQNLSKLDEQHISPTIVSTSTRSMKDAIKIAIDSRVSTRSTSEIENITPVTRFNDTTAYAINFSNDSGFILVAANTHIAPVIGYSSTGSFSMENELAKKYVLDNLPSSTENIASELIYDNCNAPVDELTHYKKEPIIKYSLGQRHPYNKVIDKYYPGCPAGCGPVAAAMAMSYCKEDLTWNGYYYNFQCINQALSEGEGYIGGLSLNNININLEPQFEKPTPFPDPERIIIFEDSYEGATQAISQLLYELGRLIGCTYTPDATSSKPENIINAVIQMGYNASVLRPFDFDSMVENMSNNKIYFQCGYLKNSNVNGHGWVVDGYEYDESADNQKKNCYIYCHWGWSGYSDGYYLIDALMPNPLNGYAVGSNFYIKMENN